METMVRCTLAALVPLLCAHALCTAAADDGDGGRLGPNNQTCRLLDVGRPAMWAHSQFGTIGSWMGDARPPDSVAASKLWVTGGYASELIYEYESALRLRNKEQRLRYYLDYLAAGTGGLVYNGSYFYHRHDTPIIIRYDMETSEVVSKSIDGMNHVDCERLEKPTKDNRFEYCNTTERHAYLYGLPHNFVDFAADENGLWIVYSMQGRTGRPYLAVSKIEYKDLSVVSTWHLHWLEPDHLANAFIMCGVLYGIDDGSRLRAKINFAYDLYNNETVHIDADWFNPSRFTTSLDYNPNDRRLYYYDDGLLLSVNVRIADNGDYVTSEAVASTSTTDVTTAGPSTAANDGISEANNTTGST